MAALNKIQIIGNLGRDPEVKTVGSSKVAEFSVAVTEKYNDKDGQKQEKTEWVNVVFWGRQAEICEQYLTKGSSVYIEGKLQTQTWEKDGEKKYKTVVQGFVMQMLGGGQTQSKPSPKTETKAEEVQDDDLPF